MRKLFSASVIFCFGLIVWVLILAFSGMVAFPAKYLLSQGCWAPSFAVARTAFSLPTPPPRFVVVGLADFVDDVSDRLGGSEDVTSVRLPTLTLGQISAAIRALSVTEATIFVQNAPHLWIDIDHRFARGSQDVRSIPPPRQSVEVSSLFRHAFRQIQVLKSLAQGAETCAGRQDRGGLPEDFLWTSFLPPDRLAREIANFNRGMGNIDFTEQVIWLFDPEWIPDDTMADTREKLLAFANVSEHRVGLGRFEPMQAFLEPQPATR